MNYSRIYELLIYKRKVLEPLMKEQYTERHRIKPGCMGGTYESENVVRLTPEEHRVAHALLAKIHPTNYKIVSAAIYMFGGTKKHSRVPLKVYGWLRRSLAKLSKGPKEKVTCPHCGKIGGGGVMKRFHFENCIIIKERDPSPLKGKKLSFEICQSRIGRPGTNNGRKFTDEQRANMSKSRLGKSQPWTSEALKKRTKSPHQIKISCIQCKKQFTALSFGQHRKSCEKNEIHRLSRIEKGLNYRQWNKPNPRKGIKMSEENKQKMKKPKINTDKMKKPKTEEHKLKLKESWAKRKLEKLSLNDYQS